MVNPNPNLEGGFLFPNHDMRRDYSSLNEYIMKIEIPFFNGNLDMEFFLDWSMKWRSSSTWLMSSRRSMSSSRLQAQGRSNRMVGPITNHKRRRDKPPVMT